MREGEWAKERGRRGEERSCSEDSSEAGDQREAQRKTKAKEGTLARRGPTRGTEEDERATRGAEGRGEERGMQRRGQRRYISIIRWRVYYVHEHKRGKRASRGL